MSKKTMVALALGGVALVGVAAMGLAHWKGWHRFGGSINALQINMAEPDAFIRTPALSKLPRDLLQAPVLRDLLTADFAFYYEAHEDRLGLLGAIKRLAFEHEVTLSDQALAWALDEPAELAFWADAKGAPRHWALAMTRGALAKMLQAASPLAGKDAQLSLISTLRLHGSEVPVLALQLSPRRTLALASLGNRVVVLSDPGLLFDAERQTDARSQAVLERLLSGDAADQTVLAAHFGLKPDASAHTLVADARLLSLGYQHFFPGLEALRLDLAPGGTSLRTSLRTGASPAWPSAAQAQALWRGVPANPAACAQVPTDAKRLQALGAEQAKAIQAVLAQLQGPAAVCWYPRSQLHTPLVVAQTKPGQAPSAAQLQALWQWLMPAKATVAAAKPGAVLQAEVAAPWGPLADKDGEGKTRYQPGLASQGDWLSFSPDGELVALAQATQAQAFPSVAETLAGSSPLALLTPKLLADMAQAEAMAVLPPSQELLHQAAQQHLLPRLAALRQMPAVRAVPQGARDAQGWTPLAWQPIAAAAAVAAKP